MSTVISLTRKGQRTIPKVVREALDLKPFDRVEVEVVGREAILRKVPLTLADSKGILPALDSPMDPDDAIRLTKEERAQRWRETFG